MRPACWQDRSRSSSDRAWTDRSQWWSSLLPGNFKGSRSADEGGASLGSGPGSVNGGGRPRSRGPRAGHRSRRPPGRTAGGAAGAALPGHGRRAQRGRAGRAADDRPRPRRPGVGRTGARRDPLRRGRARRGAGRRRRLRARSGRGHAPERGRLPQPWRARVPSRAACASSRSRPTSCSSGDRAVLRRRTTPARPRSVYGRTKLAGGGAPCSRRPPRPRSCAWRSSRPRRTARALPPAKRSPGRCDAGRPLRLFTDQYRTPVDPESVADALSALLAGGPGRALPPGRPRAAQPVRARPARRRAAGPRPRRHRARAAGGPVARRAAAGRRVARHRRRARDELGWRPRAARRRHPRRAVRAAVDISAPRMAAETLEDHLRRATRNFTARAARGPGVRPGPRPGARAGARPRGDAAAPSRRSTRAVDRLGGRRAAPRRRRRAPATRARTCSGSARSLAWLATGQRPDAVLAARRTAGGAALDAAPARRAGRRSPRRARAERFATAAEAADALEAALPRRRRRRAALAAVPRRRRPHGARPGPPAPSRWHRLWHARIGRGGRLARRRRRRSSSCPPPTGGWCSSTARPAGASTRCGSAPRSSPRRRSTADVVARRHRRRRRWSASTRRRGAERYRLKLGQLVRSSPLPVDGPRRSSASWTRKARARSSPWTTNGQARSGRASSAPCSRRPRSPATAVLVGSDDGVAARGRPRDGRRPVVAADRRPRCGRRPRSRGDRVVVGGFDGPRGRVARRGRRRASGRASSATRVYSSPCIAGRPLRLRLPRGARPRRSTSRPARRASRPRPAGPWSPRPRRRATRSSRGSTDGDLYLARPRRARARAPDALAPAACQSSPALDGDAGLRRQRRRAARAGARADEGRSRIPAWLAAGVLERYHSGASHLFLLHGNVRDVQPFGDDVRAARRRPAPRWPRGGRSSSPTTSSAGLVLPRRGAGEGVPQGPRPQGGPLPAGPGARPHRARRARSPRTAARPARSPIVIDYAHALAPADGGGGAERQSITTLARWASDPRSPRGGPSSS